MGNKKKPSTLQSTPELDVLKKAGDLDKYFKEKVKVLSVDTDDSQAALHDQNIPQTPEWRTLKRSYKTWKEGRHRGYVGPVGIFSAGSVLNAGDRSGRFRGGQRPNTRQTPPTGT
ncbi:Hypothetical predicted protein [Pelobates cultripes]|uniref:Uncharacterized protein n=1 Tax=Pelobates cultripes TaxID=61616 RepID=A0AAD1T3C6_PELCU|nr:Hypothetical predicted protein [Pelobates cultripes]